MAIGRAITRNFRRSPRNLRARNSLSIRSPYGDASSCNARVPREFLSGCCLRTWIGGFESNEYCRARLVSRPFAQVDERLSVLRSQGPRVIPLVKVTIPGVGGTRWYKGRSSERIERKR